MEKYIPRTTCPEKGDKFYHNYQYGGYNVAIPINKTNGWVMPNCVGYAQGRYREICGDTKVWSDVGNYLSGNAETFWASANAHGFKTGQEPKLGAIVVYEGAGSAAGHVCIVEKINLNADKTDIESIVTSNSAYKGTEFYMQTVTKADGYLYNKDGSRPLLGFIYQDKEYEADEPINETGFFDTLVENSANKTLTMSGWAWNGVNNTASVVIIKIFDSNNKELGFITTIADEYREDLKKAGIGNGNHGFIVNYNYTKLSEGTYTFKAYTYDGTALTNEHKFTVPQKEKVCYRVQIGSFTVKNNAKRFAEDARNKGLSVIGKYYDPFYRVQVGAYEQKNNAESMLARCKSLGYSDAFITTESGVDVIL